MNNNRIKWSNDDGSTLALTSDGVFVKGSVVSGMQNFELPRKHEDFKIFEEFGSLLIRDGDILTPYEALAIKLGLAPREWSEFVAFDSSLPPQTFGSVWRLIQPRITAPGAIKRFRKPGGVLERVDLSYTSNVQSWTDLGNYGEVFSDIANRVLFAANVQVNTILARIDEAFAQYQNILAEATDNLQKKYFLGHSASANLENPEKPVFSVKPDGKPNPIMDLLHMCNSVQIVRPEAGRPSWLNPSIYREFSGEIYPDLPRYFPFTLNPNLEEGVLPQARCDVILRIRTLLLSNVETYKSFESAGGIRRLFNAAKPSEKLALMRVWYPWAEGPKQFGNTRSVVRDAKLNDRAFCSQQQFAYSLILLHASYFRTERYLVYSRGSASSETQYRLKRSNFGWATVKYLRWVKSKCVRAVDGVQAWWGQGSFRPASLPIRVPGELLNVQDISSGFDFSRILGREEPAMVDGGMGFDFSRNLGREEPAMVDGGMEFDFFRTPSEVIDPRPSDTPSEQEAAAEDESGGDLTEETSEQEAAAEDESGGDLTKETSEQEATAATGIDPKYIYITSAVVIAGAIGAAIYVNKNRSTRSEI